MLWGFPFYLFPLTYLLTRVPLFMRLVCIRRTGGGPRFVVACAYISLAQFLDISINKYAYLYISISGSVQVSFMGRGRGRGSGGGDSYTYVDTIRLYISVGVDTYMHLICLFAVSLFSYLSVYLIRFGTYRLCHDIFEGCVGPG